MLSDDLWINELNDGIDYESSELSNGLNQVIALIADAVHKLRLIVSDEFAFFKI